MKLRLYKRSIKPCKPCPLFQSHVNTRLVPTAVYGKRVDILFVGEAPGRTEDDIGQPFVGDAGQLLKKWIRVAVGRIPRNIGFSNIVRCRPKDENDKNRKPTQAEVDCCRHNIDQDIILLNPKVIVLVGGVALEHLAKRTVVAKNRGYFFDIEVMGKKFKSLCTYHPSFILQKGQQGSDLVRLVVSDIRKACIEAGLVEGGKTYRKVDKKDFKFIFVTKVKQLREMREAVLSGKKIGFTDFETRGLSKCKPSPLCVGYCVDGKTAWIVPLRHPKTPWTSEEYEEEVIPILRSIQTLRRFKVNGKRRRVRLKGMAAHQLQFDNAVHFHEFGVSIGNNVGPVCTIAMARDTDEARLSFKEEIREPYSQKQLAKEWLDLEAYDEETLTHREKGQLHKLPLKKLLRYCGTDVIIGWHLYYYMLWRAKQENRKDNLLKLTHGLTGPVARAISHEERAGLLIDRLHLQLLMGKDSPVIKEVYQVTKEFYRFKEVKEANARLTKKLEHKMGMQPLFEDTSWHFDLNKDDHIRYLFFNLLGLDPVETTAPTSAHPNGLKSVGKKFKEAYSIKCDICATLSNEQLISLRKESKKKGTKEIAKIADRLKVKPDVLLKHLGSCKRIPKNSHRMVTLFDKNAKGQKLITSYINPVDDMLRTMEDSRDGRLHGSFNQHRTVTGRLASKEPNQQQWPQHGKNAKYIKNMIIAPRDHILVASDYSQAEVRWLAELSNDQKMIEMFDHIADIIQQFRDDSNNAELAKRVETECDVHKQGAVILFQIPIEDVDKATRQAAKSAVFGQIYGQSDETIAENNNWSLAEAERVSQRFKKQFPRAFQYIQDMRETAVRLGYVDSPFGRRRHLVTESEAATYSQVGRSERMAGNAPIQAAASDMNLYAFQILQLEAEKPRPRYRVINTVHDSIMSEVHIDYLWKYLLRAEKLMIHPPKLKERFGFEVRVKHDVEFDLGCRYGNMIKWVTWLKPIYEKISEEHKELYGRGYRDPDWLRFHEIPEAA